MINSTFSFRVRYAETDQMGVVYYGNYSIYFEMGRVELFRSIGLIYKELEDSGVLMPVGTLNVKYIKPATYDELLTVKTIVKEYPKGARINFDYEIWNENKEKITLGSTELFFLDKKTKRPVRCPEELQNKLKPYF